MKKIWEAGGKVTIDFTNDELSLLNNAIAETLQAWERGAKSNWI